MPARIPCTRHDRAGADDPTLRAVLAEASDRVQRDIAPLLRSLYTHNGELIATWQDFSDREAGSAALSAAWQALVGHTRILHLIPTDDDYDYQEDVLDNGADF